MRTHKSDGGSQWKDEITMPDHVGQELALSETCSSYRHPCKTDSFMQIQLQQVFWRSFTSSMIVFSAMRLRCEIAHLLGHVSHAGQTVRRFMAEEGTINVLFYTAKRLKEEETPVMENFLLFFQSADRMSLWNRQLFACERVSKCHRRTCENT